MKKLIMAGAIALFGLSQAQLAKGTVYVSGQADYSHKEHNEEYQSSKADVLKIIPSAGYFVGTNLAVGLGIGYKTSVTKYAVGNDVINNLLEFKENAFVVAPFIRKYWTLSDKLYLFGQLQVPMEFGQQKSDEESINNIGDPMFNYTVSRKNNYTNIGVNIKPGLDYFLSKNWSIEATLGEFGYNTYKRDIEGVKHSDLYRFGVNLNSVTFGVKYIFAK